MPKSGQYDGRLLQTLIKADKEVHDTFRAYTLSCENANNALNGWAAGECEVLQPSILRGWSWKKEPG